MTSCKRFMLRGIGLSFLHCFLAFSCFAVSFDGTMARFDDPSYQLSWYEKSASSLEDILWQPGMSLWTPWMSLNMPNAVEWVLVFANSALWGFGLLFLFQGVTRWLPRDQHTG